MADYRYIDAYLVITPAHFMRHRFDLKIERGILSAYISWQGWAMEVQTLVQAEDGYSVTVRGDVPFDDGTTGPLTVATWLPDHADIWIVPNGPNAKIDAIGRVLPCE